MQTLKLLRFLIFYLALTVAQTSCSKKYDLIIRSQKIYDGLGSAPVSGEIAIKKDKIIAIGELDDADAAHILDVGDLAVSPGFINMLSWASTRLMIDGRSLSDIKQGVTLEVFGEGWSEGPLNAKMKEDIRKRQKDFKYDIAWTTLDEFLEHLIERGISTNVASYVGASTIRIHVLGEENRQPTPEELEKMQQLTREAMRDGAVGVASALIYAPGVFSSTEELIALAKVVAEYDGIYTSHIRSEGGQLLEAVDEFLTILETAECRGEIFHLKAAGKANWSKLHQVIEKIELAQKRGLSVSADMYTYIAGATGLDATQPPWVQEGGFEKWLERLRDPETRKKVIAEMQDSSTAWENFYTASGPQNIFLSSLRSDSLKYLTGKSVAEVAKMRGTSAAETVIDLILQDDSRVEAIFFLMSEDNIKKQMQLPWVSFCSDAGSMAPEGIFLKSSPHPRAYGNFVRLLGKYVREESVISLSEAIRKLTSFPAENLKIQNRGQLKEGYFADLVIFDAAKIQDHATFENPHQLASGVEHVFVNGVQVLQNGQHTNAKPGRIVRGPGWRKSR
ncbi:MAG: D-aminoacylase [Calditrichaeota bacterium]|nr:MAG: D-aminoacylase [Calditrichota bacterium]